MRRREARTLLAAQHWPGAFYLAGYAIECALKACIASQYKQSRFPDREKRDEVWTHELPKLVGFAGLAGKLRGERQRDPEFRVLWDWASNPAKGGWSEQRRYRCDTFEREARDMCRAVSSREHGILQWIQRHY
jgi:hypothetical protein